MINYELFEKQEHNKPSQFITGLKCEVCGRPTPDKTWMELGYTSHDFCRDHMRSKKIREADDNIMACVAKGRGYWASRPSRWCLEKGVVDCFEGCPFEDCIVPESLAKY